MPSDIKSRQEFQFPGVEWDKFKYLIGNSTRSQEEAFVNPYNLQSKETLIN